jgi:predicted esterase
MAFASGYFNPQVRRRAGDFIILAPGVGDRSGWFAGDSGEEALECVAHLKKLYGVNEKAVFLDGFSKGGYGALRLALLHPQAFRAVIIRSGLIVPPADVKGENLFDLLAQGRNLSFLFVHGDQDEIAPIQDVRQAVARLQELKSSVRMIEVKGGGHADAEKWEDVFGWVRDVLGNDMVVIKPPKKEKEKEKEK